MKDGNPLGKPGSSLRYGFDDEVPEATVRGFELALGPVVETGGEVCQWLFLSPTRVDGKHFSVRLLARNFPPENFTEARKYVKRYVIENPGEGALEYRDRSGIPVLPSLGTWKYLLPRPFRPGHNTESVEYLGKPYKLVSVGEHGQSSPGEAKVLDLDPDLLIGPASNMRQREETRRWDDSDYEMVRLEEEDYLEMAQAGVNLLKVDRDQSEWLKDLNVFYWGVQGDQIEYPLDLYRSNYLGPALYLDEPAVVTRDHVIRPRLSVDEEYRRKISPGDALEKFKGHFRKVKYTGSPARLMDQLRERADVDTGSMEFHQENVYSWETMVSTAAYQLTEGPGPPKTIVFEPPGRIGTMRTLPEINMSYGCQIPIDDPKNLASIIYGFLRGAARASGGNWGMSVYGQFHRADAFWFQTHAYDLGATLFLYWDSYQLACVPFREYLALTRNLRNHEENHPGRDLARLREAAEVAILLPPGYNLGHIHMGRGLLWGVDELNLERKNQSGVPYRRVMGNFFTEVERCLRLGVPFDLVWDLESVDTSGYREVVRVAEDGTIEVREGGKVTTLREPRVPQRPGGSPPSMALGVREREQRFTARAEIEEGSSQVYYTVGAGKDGVYENILVSWELFGPEEQDYRFINWDWPGYRIESHGGKHAVEVDFKLNEPGSYRLRASVCDMAGRVSVKWAEIARA